MFCNSVSKEARKHVNKCATMQVSKQTKKIRGERKPANKETSKHAISNVGLSLFSQNYVFLLLIRLGLNVKFDCCSFKSKRVMASEAKSQSKKRKS